MRINTVRKDLIGTQKTEKDESKNLSNHRALDYSIEDFKVSSSKGGTYSNANPSSTLSKKLLKQVTGSKNIISNFQISAFSPSKKSAIRRIEDTKEKKTEVKSLGNNKEELGSNINLKKFSIEDFEVLRNLGRGRFGDVFLVREKKTDFIVALKVINKTEASKLKSEKLIVREIKIHSFIEHKNIIKLYGFFHDEDNIYLILEYASEGEIYKVLKNSPGGHFSEEKSSVYVKQVLEAFIYLQENNILHRDLKPENLLSCDGIIKLADFGWSVHSKAVTRTTFCGTLLYMAPEIAQQQDYDYKSDNWAIGVLTYEFLVGKPPFNTESSREILESITNGNLSYPSFLSYEAKNFISKLLVVNPQQRMSLQQAICHPFIIKYN